MDDKDLAILRHMQADARTTAEAIGQRVGLSQAAVQKRLQRLREQGVIEKEVAVLSPNKLGRAVTVLVQVSLHHEDLAHLEAFKHHMRQAPEVQQCYYTTGEADFMLIVVVADMAAYEAFTQQHFFSNANVARFQSSVVMDRVKVTLDVC